MAFWKLDLKKNQKHFARRNSNIKTHFESHNSNINNKYFENFDSNISKSQLKNVLVKAFWKSQFKILTKRVLILDILFESPNPITLAIHLFYILPLVILLLFISYKFVKGFLAITFLSLVISNWNFVPGWHTSWKFQLEKKTSNKIVIAKKPLTNLYEMNSTSFILWSFIWRFCFLF